VTGRPGPWDLAGLVMAAGFAVHGQWNLPEFAWGTWLAGLVFSWACVMTAGVQVIVGAPGRRVEYVERLPRLGSLPRFVFLLGLGVAVVLLCVVVLVLYTWIFALYGALLSFFAEMEPYALFGRNGFINSDFVTPVIHLLLSYWPMTAGVLLANGGDLVRGDPWRRIAFPTRTGVLRVHILVVATPFAALLAWALFGDRYHTLAIVLLMALFYLAPRADHQDRPRRAPA
jgi:hypothetical protein